MISVIAIGRISAQKKLTERENYFLCRSYTIHRATSKQQCMEPFIASSLSTLA